MNPAFTGGGKIKNLNTYITKKDIFFLIIRRIEYYLQVKKIFV